MNRAPSASIADYILQDWSFATGQDGDATEIATALETWSRPGNWLDLGCGPMLSVWPMFAPGQTAIWGCDRQVEIASFHRELTTKQPVSWPRGLLDALAFFNRRLPQSPARSTTAVGQIREVLIADVLERQLRWASFFDTVIQIGCFGSLDSVAALQRALDHVTFYLRPGGRFISATWLPRPPYVESERWGGTNLTTLSSGEFASRIGKSGLLVRDIRVSALDDPEYHERYIIAAEQRDPQQPPEVELSSNEP